MAAALQREGYHISVGVSWAPAPVEDLALLVKNAEQQMYDAKRAFYQEESHNRRAR